MKEETKIAKKIYKIYLKRAEELLRGSVWYKSCPDDLKKEIILNVVGIGTKKVGGGFGISAEETVPAVVFCAEAGNGEKMEIKIKI